MPDPQRFWSKVNRGEADACWVWQAGIGDSGYGRFWDGQRMVRAHRWAYQTEVGPIADGLTLDHLCRNRACVNPAHLEPVTSRENTLRGETIAAANARKTHCINGHSLDDARVRADGKRRCPKCELLKSMKYYRTKGKALRAQAKRNAHA